MGKCGHMRISHSNNSRRNCSARLQLLLCAVLCSPNSIPSSLSLPVSVSFLHLSLPIRNYLLLSVIHWCALLWPSSFEIHSIHVHTFSRFRQIITFFLPPGLLKLSCINMTKRIFTYTCLTVKMLLIKWIL